MHNLSQSVEYDFETGLVKIRARGELDILGAAELRTTMIKWLAEHPLGIIVDLAAVEVGDEIPLLVLPTLARRPHAVPILVIVDPATHTGRVVDHYLGKRIGVFKDEPSAVAAATSAHTASPPQVHLHMGAEPDAPARARDLVRQACDRWGLPMLNGPAQLIISELVTNSIRHARSDVEVTVALGEHYLHLLVRDRDPRIPRVFTMDSPHPEHSRGMKLIDGIASGWGTALRPYGKSVWATLRITARDPAPSP